MHNCLQMHNHSSSFQPASALLPTPSHPSPFTTIHYLKESCQLGIILEESSKHLITPWPYNPWPFTLLLFTHHCYPILPRSFGMQHASPGRKPGNLSILFLLWRNAALCSAGLPQNTDHLFQSCLMLIQSGHHCEVHHTDPCSQGEIKVLHTFSFYLNSWRWKSMLLEWQLYLLLKTPLIFH